MVLPVTVRASPWSRSAAGLEVRDLRRPGADLVERLDVEVDAGLGGQREQVEDGVGRAADRDL